MYLPLRPPVTKAEAESICGTLSRPSKMPCSAYSLPAAACKMGARLHAIEGSTCQKCYALKGRYLFPNVQAAMQKRLSSLAHPYWVDALVLLIGQTKNRYFRWHDSGDLQSLQHLLNVVEIAGRLPEVMFWLPTREVGLVRKYEALFGSFPPNLTVRVSAAMVDDPPPRGFRCTSTVVRESASCPAPKQGNKCGTCRNCWDPAVANVSYLEH